jgi:hypothetical protein
VSTIRTGLGMRVIWEISRNVWHVPLGGATEEFSAAKRGKFVYNSVSDAIFVIEGVSRSPNT